MKLKPLKTNQTELHLNDGTVVFFSYQTPVAACAGDGSGFMRTDEHYSVTTSKHINQWLAGAKARTVPQSYLEALVDSS